MKMEFLMDIILSKNTDKANTNGMMAASMLANGLKMLLMDLEPIIGQTKGST